MAHSKADPFGDAAMLHCSTSRAQCEACLLCAMGLLMTASSARCCYIQGTTLQGRTFRPSDWAERLAGAMSSFRPAGGLGGKAAYIGYSPYCVPQIVDGVKCVLVNEALRDIEPMAWDFVMSFARDNELKVIDIDPA